MKRASRLVGRNKKILVPKFSGFYLVQNDPPPLWKKEQQKKNRKTKKQHRPHLLAAPVAPRVKLIIFYITT